MTEAKCPKCGEPLVKKAVSTTFKIIFDGKEGRGLQEQRYAILSCPKCNYSEIQITNSFTEMKLELGTNPAETIKDLIDANVKKLLQSLLQIKFEEEKQKEN